MRGWYSPAIPASMFPRSCCCRLRNSRAGDHLPQPGGEVGGRRAGALLASARSCRLRRPGDGPAGDGRNQRRSTPASTGPFFPERTPPSSMVPFEPAPRSPGCTSGTCLALHLLESGPAEIDRERLGVLGVGTGGTLAAFAASLDVHQGDGVERGLAFVRCDRRERDQHAPIDGAGTRGLDPSISLMSQLSWRPAHWCWPTWSMPRTGGWIQGWLVAPMPRRCTRTVHFRPKRTSASWMRIPRKRSSSKWSPHSAAIVGEMHAVLRFSTIWAASPTMAGAMERLRHGRFLATSRKPQGGRRATGRAAREPGRMPDILTRKRSHRPHFMGGFPWEVVCPMGGRRIGGRWIG